MRAAAQVAGNSILVAGLHRRWSNSAGQGSIRAGLWPGSGYASCVIHLGQHRGLEWPGAASATAAAALRRRARARAPIGR